MIPFFVEFYMEYFYEIQGSDVMEHGIHDPQQSGPDVEEQDPRSVHPEVHPEVCLSVKTLWPSW